MVEPTPGDILLGRGVRINNHPGNEAYREIISENAVRRRIIKYIAHCIIYDLISSLFVYLIISILIISILIVGNLRSINQGR